MDWKKEAIEDLGRYQMMKIGLKNLNEELQTLELTCADAPAALRREPVVQGGAKAADDALLQRIVRRDKLSASRDTLRATLRRIDRALKALSEEERCVLTRFYIERAPGAALLLCAQLRYEQAHIYRIKDAALKKFTIAMYGSEQI